MLELAAEERRRPAPALDRIAHQLVGAQAPPRRQRPAAVDLGLEVGERRQCGVEVLPGARWRSPAGPGRGRPQQGQELERATNLVQGAIEGVAAAALAATSDRHRAGDRQRRRRGD
jgi:hypothetical protein